MTDDELLDNVGRYTARRLEELLLAAGEISIPSRGSPTTLSAERRRQLRNEARRRGSGGDEWDRLRRIEAEFAAER